tara:strand:+ start:123 stop:299 length:177 start_codon:yes stop_codon:yes gene_type:complete
MPEQVEPLSEAENLLLDAFIGCLNDVPNGSEIFHATCDLVEGLTQAAKAKVKLDKLKK